ncbi:Pyruvate decarboxylase like protein [Verticillium longisporum]|nr:Pyruvate decarboxylase like protein [Verticillium longisporum]
MPAAIFPSTTSEELYACRAQVLCAMIAEAERPMILVDGFTARFDIREEINELVRISQIPTLTTPFGKGIVNETLPGYKGIFCGAMGNKELQDWVDGCDLVLHFGPLRSDVNTFGFSARTNVSKTLFFEKNAVEHDDSTNLLLLNEVSATKLLVQYTVDIYEATILFEGEGSLQMSAQAISDMIRNRLDVIIFVINNGGYTIERLIHGFSASCNDVQPWRNLEAPSFFGAPRDDLLYPTEAEDSQDSDISC